MNEKSFENIKEYVEEYLKLGFCIVPAHRGKKQPKFKWRKYQKEHPSEKEIQGWFKSDESYNIAVLCGKVSGNLVVLDFDDASIYPNFFKTEELEKETIVVKTGSGKYHVYLRTNKAVPSFRIPELKLEVRSEGNIVIAPRSKHPSGGIYEFVNPEIKEILLVDDLENAIWKKAEELGVKSPQMVLDKSSGTQADVPYLGEDPPCVKKLLCGVQEGLRNEAAIRLASYYLKFRNVEEKQVFQRLEKWNIKNKPKLETSELLSIFESAKELQYSYGCRSNQAWCDVNSCILKKRQIELLEAQKEAETILSSTDLMTVLKPHLDNILAGEDENKQLMFVLLLSGVLDDSKLKQMLLVKGESGAGKSTLMKLADVFKTKTVGRFSKHALDHSNLADYQILRLKEIGKMDQEDQGVSTIKFVSSDDDGYNAEIVSRDEKGKFKNIQCKVPAITLVTSTTRVSMDPQFQRRCWILNADESNHQTEKIRLWKVNKELESGLEKLGILKKNSYDTSVNVLKSLLEKLENVSLILIFPDSLTKLLKSSKLRVRGDYSKVISLVKLFAFLHQRTLPQAKDSNGKKVVFVTPECVFEALELAQKPFTTMTTDLEERQRRLIQVLREMKIVEADDDINTLARIQIASKLNTSDRTVHRHLKQLCDKGYMSSFKDKLSKGHPLTFMLLYDLDVIESKQAVSFDINAAETENGSNFKKEIKEWLDQYSDKIVPWEGWTIQGIRDSLLEGNVSFRNEFLSKKQMKEKTDSNEEIKGISVVASVLSEDEALELDSKCKEGSGD